MHWKDLTQISEWEWEIPKSFRADMRVPVRVFATRELLEQVMGDKSLEQAVNAATLPGLVGQVMVMPDMHQGYGFPIGGVAATRYPDGVISPGAIGYDIGCLRGDTPVLHEFGYTRQIADFGSEAEGQQLRCFRLDKTAIDTAQVALWFGRPPAHPVLRLTVETGQQIEATSDHPFWTKDGMVALGRLREGDEVALYPLVGVPYQDPGDAVILDEAHLSDFLQSLGKGAAGNALNQILNVLRARNLNLLRYDSPVLPLLIKILGFLFGDGTLRFDTRTHKGMVAFYGKPDDLEQIRTDVLRLGFKPSRVWSRSRSHRIQTTYGLYEFENNETWFAVNSTAFAALLACLGAPVGRKTSQAYGLPNWLNTAVLWQKRLFLAAYFGAELSAPQMQNNEKNFSPPLVSMNKREAFQASGVAFLEEMCHWLQEFGVLAHVLPPRLEQTNADGSRSVRLRLMVAANSENLQRFWSQIGIEYQNERRAAIVVAAQYVALKLQRVAARQAMAQMAVELRESGHSLQQVTAALAGDVVNARFVERSVYAPRQTAPRVGEVFEDFDAFRERVCAGLGQSGMVWQRITAIEAVESPGLVYDVTMNHGDHNFIAGGFVVSNCGVRLLGSSIDVDDAAPLLADLASALNAHCPSGVGEDGALRVTDAELDAICRDGARWALKKGYASEMDVRRTEESGSLARADPNKISKRARERGRSQLGSLGAGNHFIEVDVVDEVFHPQAADAMGLRRGALVLQIHCGSRGLGHQVCTDYVQAFQGAAKRYGIVLPDRELVCAPLNSPEGEDYLAAMRAAGNFAFVNRQILAWQARQAFEEVFAGKLNRWQLHQVYDIAHNMGKIETHLVGGAPVQVCVHRKGATRAFGPGTPEVPPEYREIGQPVLVPGSMGTASWVLTGTETSMARSFGSSCHGAGRVMSRSAAKKTIRGDALRADLQADGIEIRAGSLAGLAEEAPQAYKDVDAVVETVAGAQIAVKVARLRPLAVIKG